jgi:hypothetical protein
MAFGTARMLKLSTASVIVGPPDAASLALVAA